MAAPIGMVNYAGIPLKIDHIASWATRPVYSSDDCDRLYLHHRIAAECWWNPEATRSGIGKLGAVSIAELRQQLLRERQVLTITIGGQKILESPKLKAPGVYYRTDARNGPLPIGLTVLQITGDKTVKCLFEIETWAGLDCPGQTQARGKQSVLSHRWDMSERIDETFLSTRTVAGTATFRTDFLLDGNSVPDDFRGRLAHPIAPFFQRQNVSVKAKSGGTAVDYSFDDRETPGVNIIGGTNGAIAKVRGTWRYGWSNPGSGFGFQAAAKGLLGLAAKTVSVTIQAWGRRRARRQDLINACVNGARAFGFDQLSSEHVFQHMSLDVDLWDKFAQLNAGIFLDGALGNIIEQGSKVTEGVWRGALKGLFGFIPGIENIPGLSAEDAIRDAVSGINQFTPISKARTFIGDFPDGIENLTTTLDIDNPRAPGPFGTRGHSLETLVAQVLLEQCGTPGKPRNWTGTAREEKTF